MCRRISLKRADMMEKIIPFLSVLIPILCFTIQSYLKKKDLLIQRQKMSSGLCAIHLKAEVSRQSPLEIRISACSRDILHVCLQEQLPMMQKRSQRL